MNHDDEYCEVCSSPRATSSFSLALILTAALFGCLTSCTAAASENASSDAEADETAEPTAAATVKRSSTQHADTEAEALTYVAVCLIKAIQSVCDRLSLAELVQRMCKALSTLVPASGMEFTDLKEQVKFLGLLGTVLQGSVQVCAKAEEHTYAFW